MDGPAPDLSVIIVSRGRPAHLALCLQALTLQDHPGLEVVLVADPAGLAVRPDLPVKRIAFADANIPGARNAGLAQAGSGLVAFIDDDAVPEPEWASALARALVLPGVVAAAGVTRGPDGLGWQVEAETITPDGTRPLPLAGPTLLTPADGMVLSTIGTNCAFHRDALLGIGGFDPAFAYHRDDADVNLRLAAAFPHAVSVAVPGAEVIHGAAAGTVRDAGRLPSDLRPIGRSAALFALRYGGDPQAEARAQRARLLRLMVAGTLDPVRVRLLLAQLRAGAASAGDSPPPEPPPWPEALWPVRPRLPFPTRLDRPRLDLSGWHWQAPRLRAEARRAAADGAIVRLLLLTPTLLPHRRRFTEDGFWEQRGGLWGPSRPGDPPLLAIRRRTRVARELGVA